MNTWRWNLFDLIVVAAQFLEITMSGVDLADSNTPGALSLLRIVRVLRLVRAARVVRLLRYISELRAIVVSMSQNGYG